MKKKILMLEGPIQTGKSTLIRTMLGDHLPKCGGFTSQRLIDASGRTKGFRLCPAAADLTGPDEGITEDVFKYFRQFFSAGNKLYHIVTNISSGYYEFFEKTNRF